MGLNYDLGISRVIYFGSSTNVRRRLLEHAKSPHNRIIDLANEISHDNIVVSFCLLPNFQDSWLRSLEAATLWAFERRFGVVPIGNLDMPNWLVAANWDGLVNVNPCLDAYEPLTLDQFAKKLGLECHRETQIPLWLPGSDFGIALGLDIRDNQPGILNREYKVARFYTPGEFQRAQEIKHSYQYNALKYTEIENIAEWSIEKMKNVAKICAGLEFIKGAKVLRRYQSLTRDVPTPHTWGEVAMLQGRLTCGQWHPEQKIRIEIIHHAELLAKANLSASFAVGEDISDLPQTQHRRPSYRHRYDEDKEETAAWERHWNNLPDPPNAIGHIVSKTDSYGNIIEEWYTLKPGVEERIESDMVRHIEDLLTQAGLASA